MNATLAYDPMASAPDYQVACRRTGNPTMAAGAPASRFHSV